MNLYSAGSDGTKIQNSWSRVGTLTNALDHLITLDPPRRGPFSLSLFPWLVLNIAWTELLNSADLKPDWNRTCYRFFFLWKLLPHVLMMINNLEFLRAMIHFNFFLNNPEQNTNIFEISGFCHIVDCFISFHLNVSLFIILPFCKEIFQCFEGSFFKYVFRIVFWTML